MRPHAEEVNYCYLPPLSANPFLEGFLEENMVQFWIDETTFTKSMKKYLYFHVLLGNFI